MFVCVHCQRYDVRCACTVHVVQARRACSTSNNQPRKAHDLIQTLGPIVMHVLVPKLQWLFDAHDAGLVYACLDKVVHKTNDVIAGRTSLLVDQLRAATAEVRSLMSDEEDDHKFAANFEFKPLKDAVMNTLQQPLQLAQQAHALFFASADGQAAVEIAVNTMDEAKAQINRLAILHLLARPHAQHLVKGAPLRMSLKTMWCKVKASKWEQHMGENIVAQVSHLLDPEAFPEPTPEVAKQGASSAGSKSGEAPVKEEVTDEPSSGSGQPEAGVADKGGKAKRGQAAK